jgi:two-component system phosphate regulon sensor histidine kinase PhoR
MSISLLGIIFVQVYWFNTSLEKSEEQFKFHIKQVLGNVAEKLQKQEEYAFYSKRENLKKNIGKEPPSYIRIA